MEYNMPENSYLEMHRVLEDVWRECKIILPSVLNIEVDRKKNEVIARYL